jgi:hypothetical protein
MFSEQTKQLQPSRIGEFFSSITAGVLRAVAPIGPAEHHPWDWPTLAEPFHDRGKRLLTLA